MTDSQDIDPIDQAFYDDAHSYRDSNTGRKGIPALAKLINMAASTLQNKADRFQEFAQPSIKEARAVMAASKSYLTLHALAADLGFACIPLPGVEYAADMDLLNAWAEWSNEFGETAAAIKEALEDGRVTFDEVNRVRRELTEDYEKGMAMLEVMRAMCEPEGEA